MSATALLIVTILTGSASDGAASAPKVPTTDHVRLTAAGSEWSGWVLDAAAEEGYALLADDGRIALLPRQPPPTLLEVAARPVSEVPTPALVAGLAHAAEGVRDRCEELLVDQGEVALPLVCGALGDDSAEARRRGLAIVSAQAAKFVKAARGCIAQVRGCLDDRDARVRQAALHAYAQLAPTDLFKRCGSALHEDDSPLVQHEAILCLGALGDLHGVDLLLEHLAGCEERNLRLVTFDSLRRITGRKLGRDEEAWRAWWTNHRSELLGEDEPGETGKTGGG